jgi:flavin-dependent dehydrogenase
MACMVHDAIIIGAGPAGSVAAILLARAGWSVAIVEKSVFPRRKVCGEYLSPTNHPLFAELGLAGAITSVAGPAIRRMGLYARDATLTAPMPRPAASGEQGWGRALGRETLDTLLLDAARAAGASVFQPWSVTAQSVADSGVHSCTLAQRGETMQIAGRMVIDAHGGGIDRAATPHRPSDLLGFKAHFHDASLAPDLMPLLVFPGGYGGLVTTSDNRVCFGCCVRRDVAEQARATEGGTPADAVLRYVKQACDGVAQTLDGATLAGPWLGTGHVVPGIRPRYQAGTFRVGSAAGETHPLVGEGMSMAMQAAWLLATQLTAAPGVPQGAALDEIGSAYAAAWRRRFAPRIHAASVFASLAMRRGTVSVLLPVLRRLPALLTYGAAHSGKTRMVVGVGI